MPRPRETLTEGPVTLRRWRADPENAAELTRVVAGSLEHLRPWMPWAQGAYGLAEAEAFLAVCEEGWESGTEFNYAITSGGEVAGCCGLMTRTGPGGLEIGYWVSADRVRQGLATAAAAALTAEALTLPGISHVEIRHNQRNIASGAIPRKLGYTRVGTEPSPDPPDPDGTPAVDVLWRLGR
jgi:RimJ/RimL family protein N-acetyltransferase